MKAMSGLLKNSGKFTLTAHAKERIRQRIGVDALDAQLAWANEAIASAKETITEGHQTIYVTESYRIVCDGLRVVTVSPYANTESYAERIGSAVKREARKLIEPQQRLLRKAEIAVAELNLNYLKARNPLIKEKINKRLVSASDERQRLNDELYAMKQAAKRYGAEV